MSEEKLSKALNVDYDPSVDIVVPSKKDITNIRKERRDNILNNDFDTARKNITDMISTGIDAVEGIMKVATAGDSPRAYEVVSMLIKTIADMNKDLIELHTKVNEAEKDKITVNTTNNSIYVGSTTDLQNLLNKSRSHNKPSIIDKRESDDNES